MKYKNNHIKLNKIIQKGGFNLELPEHIKSDIEKNILSRYKLEYHELFYDILKMNIINILLKRNNHKYNNNLNKNKKGYNEIQKKIMENNTTNNNNNIPWADCLTDTIGKLNDIIIDDLNINEMSEYVDLLIYFSKDSNNSIPKIEMVINIFFKLYSQFKNNLK
jgi:hypothetical protein